LKDGLLQNVFKFSTHTVGHIYRKLYTKPPYNIADMIWYSQHYVPWTN